MPYYVRKYVEALGTGFSNWYKSFLSERTQKVKIGDTVSDSMPGYYMWSAAGKHPGSSLFLCYVNDMPMSVECKLLLYADDSILLVSQLFDTLSRDLLETCNEWLIDNRLSLHLGPKED